MRYGFVVPRYGTEVIGGAELGARMLAERLVALAGWEVEVFTTCALEATTWADHYPPGTVDVHGVVVHRFASAAGRHPRFDALSGPVLAAPAKASRAAALEWVDRQGPVNPALLDAAEASACDLVAFYPYLYHPTVHGVPRLGRRAVLHPAAHDEPPLRLGVFAEVFGAARGLVFQTEGERALVEALYPSTVTSPQALVGLGVDDPAGAAPTPVADSMDGRPYVVYVGRVDRGKGTDLLARFFAAYKVRHPGDLALVIAGPVVHEPPAHPDIVVAGSVGEADKWALLGGARAFVHPSAYEAFGIVVVEAWTAGTPVLVNGACAATREHAERSGGGLWFTGYATFERCLERLVAEPGLRAALAANGARHAEAYRWPEVIGRYTAFADALA